MSINSFVLFRRQFVEKAFIRLDDEIGVVKSRVMSEIAMACLQLPLDEILHHREAIISKVEERLKTFEAQYGIKIVDVQIEAINVGQRLIEGLATLPIAGLNSKANFLKAKNDLDVASLYQEASKIFSSNPISLQLEYFEVLKFMCEQKETTLVMPDSIIGDKGKIEGFELY